MVLNSTMKEHWDSLLNDPASIPSIRVFPELKDRFICIGLKTKSPETRMLFMIVEPSSTMNLPTFPSIHGLSLTTETDTIYRPGKIRLQLELLDIDRASIFDVLIGDIVNTISQSGTEDRAVTALINRIYEWQSTFEKSSLKTMTEARQRGLYGELICLRDLLFPQAGVHHSILSWHGASRNHGLRDFEYSGVGIEVKTTVSKNPKTFSVANERQLDDSHMNAVIIHHLSLDMHLTVGESLVEIINDISNLIENQGTRMLFEQRLTQYGYSDEHEETYSKWKYSIRDQYLFKISSTFPRIVESDLKIGVSNVRYEVSIDQCMDFEIEVGDFYGIVEESNQ